MQAMFAALLFSQAIHSFEEWYFQLWAVYSPARVLSEFFGPALSLNFALLNVVFVTLMCASVVVFVRRPGELRWLPWLWVGIELINGTNHIFQALMSGSYFPGVYTAPMLLVFATGLCVTLLRRPR